MEVRIKLLVQQSGEDVPEDPSAPRLSACRLELSWISARSAADVRFLNILNLHSNHSKELMLFQVFVLKRMPCWLMQKTGTCPTMPRTSHPKLPQGGLFSLTNRGVFYQTI